MYKGESSSVVVVYMYNNRIGTHFIAYILTLYYFYKGLLVNGKFDGQGSLTYGNGARYFGNFKEGMRYDVLLLLLVVLLLLLLLLLLSLILILTSPLLLLLLLLLPPLLPSLLLLLLPPLLLLPLPLQDYDKAEEYLLKD